jgi:hypothetical protein
MEANILPIDTAPRSLIHRYPATRPRKFIRKTGTWNQQCRCRWNLGRRRPSSRNFKRRLPSRNHPRCRSVIHGSGTATKNGVGTDNLDVCRAYWSRARGGEDRDKGMGILGSCCSNDLSSATRKVLHFTWLDMGFSSCATSITSATG